MFIRKFARNLTVAALFLLAGLPALAQHHSADTTPDQQILLSESLRAVQLFNSGGFHCMAGIEDGYAPGPDAAQQTCAPHDSDYLPRDWSVNLTEPLRVIQFLNTGGYHTECGTEDDFAPGMGGLFACSAAGEGEGQPEGVLEGEGQSEGEVTILLPGGVPLEMVRIPAGSFQMGSPDTERSRDSDEGPVHAVTIGYDFYLARYEVTQAQWLAVMGSWPGTAPSTTYGLGDRYPAYYVSWYDAQAFIVALNAHIAATGQGPATMRLPSEAEWEYACRAGTQTRFYFGDSLAVGDACEDDGIRSQYMWYCGNNASSGQPGYGTKPVGGLLPNAFGLYDMSGNLWEWCEDDWHGSYTGAPTNGNAWVNSPRASTRMLRGGIWNHIAWYCRSADRGNNSPSYRGNYIGFRLASVR